MELAAIYAMNTQVKKVVINYLFSNLSSLVSQGCQSTENLVLIHVALINPAHDFWVMQLYWVHRVLLSRLLLVGCQCFVMSPIARGLTLPSPSFPALYWRLFGVM